jgi:RNA polymerase sigma factor (sigma-70 family)
VDADEVVAQEAETEPDRPAPPPRGYESFYRDSYPRLMVAAMHAGASAHEADEVTAETLHQMLDIWTEIDHPRAYARRALFHNLVDLRRKEERRRANEAEYQAGVFERPGDELPAYLEDPQLRDDILSALTPQQRTIVELIGDGLDPGQIGLLLGKTEATVRRTVSNMRRRLAEKGRASQLAATREEA